MTDAALEAAAAQLPPGDDLLFFSLARGPAPETGSGLSLTPVVIVTRWIGRHASERSARLAGDAAGFPIAPMMYVGFTERQVLVWRSSRRWALGPLLGAVDRARIVTASAPTVSLGWRTVVVGLSDAPDVRLRVPHDRADALAARLPLR